MKTDNLYRGRIVQIVGEMNNQTPSKENEYISIKRYMLVTLEDNVIFYLKNGQFYDIRNLKKYNFRFERAKIGDILIDSRSISSIKANGEIKEDYIRRKKLLKYLRK